jgi:protocatechuate 4,5-dioxygenase alpha chain
MTQATDSVHDIPGTVIFDGRQARAGYPVNMFCISLMKEENRQAFRQDERAYLARFPMSPAQQEAVLARDYNRMISLGGNIYFLAKLGATDGKSFQQLAAQMSGVSQAEYAEMMLNGGRSPDGNRSKSEWVKHG